ncbi:MAG TPA: DUF4268 domain-containing protein, partial [Cytophagales bacterium]|nr:DUF4268 domain-containing protein [Cytophagales bacterium]
ELSEEWEWSLHESDVHGALASRIYKEQEGLNIYNKADWPDMISFLKSRMLALDAFWCNWKYGFEELN